MSEIEAWTAAIGGLGREHDLQRMIAALVNAAGGKVTVARKHIDSPMPVKLTIDIDGNYVFEVPPEYMAGVR